MYRNCTHPITSYGCIVFRWFRNSLQYLMVQRRDSLAYVEFLRGKYRLDNVKYISRLLQGMTRDELNRLRDLSFTELWNRLWTGASRNFIREQTDADAKLTHLRNGYCIGGDSKNEPVSLDELMDKISDDECLPETEWGWPKGRRDLMETDRECAVREFWEETGIRPHSIRFLDGLSPVQEEYTGSNGIRYRHVYFLAEYVGPYHSTQSRFQSNEIKSVKWMDVTEVMSKLSTVNVPQEKRTLLRNVHTDLSKKINAHKRILIKDHHRSCSKRLS
jgi:ADP-ribose pyrophosphatase YjhB (NUDIX family)